jgi:hypothetical protein
LSARAEWITLIALEAAAHRNVVHNVTLGVGSTNSNARISAMFVDAGQVAGAVSVDDAFRSAARVRISKVRCNTSTASLSVVLSALSILTTRRRIAGRALNFHRSNNFRAADESISFKIAQTAAVRSVVDDITFGIGSASSSARVLTLFSDASLVGGTLGAGDALRSAVRRASKEVLLARADGVSLLDNTSRVRSAWRRITRIP